MDAHTHARTLELTIILPTQYLGSNVVWSATESASCIPGPQSLLRGGEGRKEAGCEGRRKGERAGHIPTLHIP